MIQTECRQFPSCAKTIRIDDNFTPMARHEWRSGRPGVAPVVSLLAGSLLVVAELAALPYLLKMSASSNIIRVSKVCGFIILAALSVLEGMAAVSNATSTLFGATANLPGGLWALLFLSALWVLLLRVNFIDKKEVNPGANSRKNKRKKIS